MISHSEYFRRCGVDYSAKTIILIPLETKLYSYDCPVGNRVFMIYLNLLILTEA